MHWLTVQSDQDQDEAAALAWWADTSESDKVAVWETIQAMHGSPMRGVTPELLKVEAERDALLARIKVLEAALKPFAEYATLVDDEADEHNPIGDTCPPRHGPKWTLAGPLPTLGHCRAARDALKGAKP